MTMLCYVILYVLWSYYSNLIILNSTYNIGYALYAMSYFSSAIDAPQEATTVDAPFAIDAPQEATIANTPQEATTVDALYCSYCCLLHSTKL